MRLTLTGRGIEITDGLRRLVERKLVRLERVLNDKGVSGQIELRVEKFRKVIEIHVHARGGHMFQARTAATGWAEAMTEAVDRIVQQTQRLKGKWQGRKREAKPIGQTGEAQLPPAQVRRIVRARRYAVQVLSVEEASQQVGPTGDAFVVFRNRETDVVSVLYRRKDGDLGLIEPKG